MAERGGQPGNKNPSKNKPWREALDRALAQFERKDAEGNVLVGQGEALRAIADRVVNLAMAGDKDAWQEIGNRLDGKAIQEIAGKVDAELNVTIKQFSLPGGN